VVRGGDTLTAIATRFGFTSWRDIYHHPDNAPFRKKRPNPDKIFPGDVLVIPGRPVDSSLLPAAGHRVIPFVPSPPSLPVAVPQQVRTKGPIDDPWVRDYKHPGNIKVRLTLFWVTNCVNMESSAEALLAKADEIFARHGLGLDVFPSRHRTPEHTIGTPPNVVAAGGLLINNPPEYNHYNEIRLEAARRFDDQKTKDRRPRLPVFFCEFKYPATGITVIGSPWLPYVFLSGVLAADRATLAHEVVHAAGLPRHFSGPHLKKNVMHEAAGSRSEMFKFQVQAVAKAYFSR
jgi:hypothetical protein